MTELDTPSAYVRLGLPINQHFPGYVDAYYGPPELRLAIQAEQELPPDDLEAFAQSLEDASAADLSMPADRREFLSTELGAMRTTLRILRGDVDFLSEPAPTGSFIEPSVALASEKQLFGSSRQACWFGL